jgi:hypothetical protein
MNIGRTVRILAGLCLAGGLLAIGVVWHNWGDTWGDTWRDTQTDAATAALSPSDKTAQIERGQYLYCLPQRTRVDPDGWRPSH